MKKKIGMKLMAMTLLLIVSIAAVITASFAWFSMSENPAVSGLQITLSSGNTILIAADVTEVVDGVVYHYPGEFSDTLNFSQYASYDYLADLGGLSPVSTADGIHWFLPTYYGEEDPEVLAGLASAGDLRPVQEFALDASLSYANQDTQSENLMTGHYIYLDFWVVSPGTEYKLRISGGEDSGTFVIDLLSPEETSDTATGYTLFDTGITSTSTSVRVGFLASSQYVRDDSMVYYQSSAGYDSRFHVLRGVYVEQGTTPETTDDYSFMIYEPNADAHPTGAAQDGAYVATYPLGMVLGVPTPVSVLGQTAVQLTNWWVEADNGSGLMIQQIFQTALYGKSDYAAAAAGFYTNYLQGQFSSYISRGAFIKRSSALQDTISPERLQTLEKGGATEDVYIIELERNVPQRIRMYIWLEGQDVDWDPSAAGDSFALSIEFAGSNQ